MLNKCCIALLWYIAALFTQNSSFEQFGRILSSPFPVPLRQKDDNILNFISLTSQNNKIKNNNNNNNKMYIYSQEYKRDTATASANYCRPNTQIAKKKIKNCTTNLKTTGDVR